VTQCQDSTVAESVALPDMVGAAPPPRGLDTLAHTKIDCLVLLSGNRAPMSGFTTHTNDFTVFIPGEYVHFVVDDSGEDRAARPTG
jgi:hypothetical protein